ASMTNLSLSGYNFARSTNGGASFQTTFSLTASSLPGAMVAVGLDVLGANNIAGGAVYFVTNTGNSFAATYTFYRSTDGGATFQLMSAQNFVNYVGTNVNGRHSVQNMRTRPYPFIGADNSNGTYRGRLYLVYASNNPAGNGNKPDIFCRYSNDQGVTWSTPVIVNDDANSQNNHQWFPSIWNDLQTGRLYVKWMDTRDTPTSDSAYIYASYSDDGGQTFVTNQRISNAKMRINCATCGGGGTPRYQGDYDAITSYGDVSMLVWTDFRNGQFGSYTAYFPDFALLASPSADSVGNNNDSTYYTVNVPATTLYNLDATFSATVVPPPGSGTIELTFEPSNVLSTFPGSVQLKVKTLNTVTNATYTVNIEGKGPNGIPVHRRSVQLVVTNVIPVELVSFKASVGKDNIVLIWATATETNNRGFEVEKMYSNNGNTGSWEKVAFIDGQGTTTSLSIYNYSDKNVNNPGVYSYRLKQIDYDGTSEYSNTVEEEIVAPNKYNLAQNFPNPFNPSTKISYSIPVAGDVSINIYSVVGELVTTLVNEKQEAGSYEVEFSAKGGSASGGDAYNLTSGVYFYKLVSGEYSQTNKMILLR
ncbi:MAG: T9SS type A sorting domain-containing protein, partial [Ignavibacteria bacterium]|nr:T9SS type A sorting domain-containing protein [Ignavibacteria bacterium]